MNTHREGFKGNYEAEEFHLTLSILQHYHDECVEMNKSFAPEVSQMIQYYLNIVAQDLGFTLNTTPDLQQAMKERWEETDKPTQAMIEMVRELREPKERTVQESFGTGRKPS